MDIALHGAGVLSAGVATPGIITRVDCIHRQGLWHTYRWVARPALAAESQLRGRNDLLFDRTDPAVLLVDGITVSMCMPLVFLVVLLKPTDHPLSSRRVA